MTRHTLWFVVLLLAGCGATVPLPVGPGHPASPQAAEAPRPPASTAFTEPVRTPKAGPEAGSGHEDHPMHHGGHR